MQVRNAGTLYDYIACLQADHEEVMLLFRDLLIRVTSFFRDKQTFRHARIAGHSSACLPTRRRTVRCGVWVPGCATGEEAYSLAILLREHMDKLRVVPKVQLFATDIDDSSIGTARLGRYPGDTCWRGLHHNDGCERFFMYLAGQLRRFQGDSRSVHLLHPQFGARSAFFPHGSGVLPQFVDLHEFGSATHGSFPHFIIPWLRAGILLLGGSESASHHARSVRTTR